MNRKYHLFAFLFLFMGAQLSTVAAQVILETGVATGSIVVLRGKTNAKEVIKPWRADKRSFLLEAIDPGHDSILTDKALTLRLYQPSDRKVTKWINCSQNVLIADCFAIHYEKNVDLKDFIVPGYLSDVIAKPENRLRANHDKRRIWGNNILEFTVARELSFSWPDSVEVSAFCVSHLTTGNVLLRSSPGSKPNYADSIVQCIDYQSTDLYVFNLTYHTANTATATDSVLFRLSPIALQSNPTTLFETLDSIVLNWHTTLPNVALSIDNHEGKTIWRAKHYTKNNFSPDATLKLQPCEIYTLTIAATANKQHLQRTLNFGYLLSPAENQLLSDFLTPKK